MAIRIVRLGEPRAQGEGLRIGTVRKPPRGVPKERFATDDWYDVWYPDLAPSDEAFEMARAAKTDREWAAFKRRFHKEMNEPHARRTLDLFAALSKKTSFSVGCYCENEAHCHRSVLRELFEERGADVR